MPAPLSQPSPSPASGLPALYLYPLNDSFVPKHISLATSGTRVKIGRQTNAKTTPGERNGYFDSKVLSRAHAEIWEDGGKIFIKDVKSSNGTFINGERLSAEGIESEPNELKSDDIVEFGIDIVGEDNKTIVHHKVAARAMCIFSEQDAAMAARSEQQHMPQSMHQPGLGQPNGQPMNSLQNQQQKSGQFSQPRLAGIGGMGGSMRPPGKSGLTFEHILTRLQGELQKSRDTGSDLGQLSGSMGDIGETLGGALPPTLPNYPNPTSLPPVRPLQHHDEQPVASSSTDVDGKQRKPLAEQLDDHEQKVRVLEEKLKEHEGMWGEIRSMLLAKQRAEEEEREYQRQREEDRERDNMYDDDDDDAKSIATVTGGLETVDEEDEPEDAAHHDQTLHHDQDDNEHEDRKRDHVRPHTPEPSLALQNHASPPAPEPVPQPDYSSLIADLTQKVTQLTEQLAESRDVIRNLEEKVASILVAPVAPPPQPNIDWAQKWEEMARRVGHVEDSVEKVKEATPDRRSMEDILPPSPRSLSSDSLRQRRRGRSSSSRRNSTSSKPIIEALVELKPNGIMNGHAHHKENGDVVKAHHEPLTMKDRLPALEPTLSAFGVAFITVTAIAVIWRVKD